MYRQSKTVPTAQHGAVLPLVAISLVVLLGMAGLALDLGHAYVNKTRLQNALDAAALSGAQTLMNLHNTNQAEQDAKATFTSVVNGPGNAELQAINNNNVIVQFSNTLVPFTPGAVDANANFIRVRVNNFNLNTWLVRVLGFQNQTIGASAVAGPAQAAPPGATSPVCGLTPLLVCVTNQTGPDYGLNTGVEIAMKIPAGVDSPIGPGNFQLARLPGSNCEDRGGNCVREELAGGTGCINGGNIPTKTGNTVGPVYQGVNTRFGIYQGGMKNSDYPPDKVTNAGPNTYPDTYAQYTTDYTTETWDEPNGSDKRREIAVPLVNCAGKNNGSTELDFVHIGCFFLTQPAAKQGNDQYIYGQWIPTCQLDASVNPDPGQQPGPSGNPGQPFILVLFKDPDSGDS